MWLEGSRGREEKQGGRGQRGNGHLVPQHLRNHGSSGFDPEKMDRGSMIRCVFYRRHPDYWDGNNF